jgi:hypothetical protein
MKDGTSMAEMVRFVADAMKLKARMIARGQTAVKVKCGKCSGYLHASIVGKKNHIHLHCDGPCQRRMVE